MLTAVSDSDLIMAPVNQRRQIIEKNNERHSTKHTTFITIQMIATGFIRWSFSLLATVSAEVDRFVSFY